MVQAVDQVAAWANARENAFIDKFLQIGPTTLLVKGALRGSRVAFEAETPSGVLAFEQVAFINSPTDKAWDLAVGCSLTCFHAHRRVIDGIVKSFTVTASRS